MNKKALIAVAVIIVIAAAYLFISQNKSKDDSAAKVPETRLADDSEMIGNESLRALALKGKPLQCEVNQGSMNGKFYVDGKNMRSDFSTTASGKATTGHMIVTNDTSYTWMDGEKTGFKMTLSAEQQASAETGAQKQEKVDLDAKYDYKCTSWSKNSSYFEVPSDVTFNDLSAMMNAGANASGSANLKVIQCAACDKVPAESKAECKAALGCN
jgi:hypothetical protein